MSVWGRGGLPSWGVKSKVVPQPKKVVTPYRAKPGLNLKPNPVRAPKGSGGINLLNVHPALARPFVKGKRHEPWEHRKTQSAAVARTHMPGKPRWEVDVLRIGSLSPKALPTALPHRAVPGRMRF